MVGLTSYDSLSEEAHKVVCHYYKIEGCLCGKEVIDIKAVHPEVFLEFFYPVFLHLIVVGKVPILPWQAV